MANDQAGPMLNVMNNPLATPGHLPQEEPDDLLCRFFELSSNWSFLLEGKLHEAHKRVPPACSLDGPLLQWVNRFYSCLEGATTVNGDWIWFFWEDSIRFLKREWDRYVRYVFPLTLDRFLLFYPPESKQLGLKAWEQYDRIACDPAANCRDRRAQWLLTANDVPGQKPSLVPKFSDQQVRRLHNLLGVHQRGGLPPAAAELPALGRSSSSSPTSRHSQTASAPARNIWRRAGQTTGGRQTSPEVVQGQEARAGAASSPAEDIPQAEAAQRGAMMSAGQAHSPSRIPPPPRRRPGNSEPDAERATSPGGTAAQSLPQRTRRSKTAEAQRKGGTQPRQTGKRDQAAQPGKSGHLIS